MLPREDEVLRFSVSQRPRNFDPSGGGYLEPVVEQQLASLLEREVIFKREWSALGMQDLVSYMRQEKARARREDPAAFFEKPLIAPMPPFQETFRHARTSSQEVRPPEIRSESYTMTMTAPLPRAARPEETPVVSGPTRLPPDPELEAHGPPPHVG